LPQNRLPNVRLTPVAQIEHNVWPCSTQTASPRYNNFLPDYSHAHPSRCPPPCPHRTRCRLLSAGPGDDGDGSDDSDAISDDGDDSDAIHVDDDDCIVSARSQPPRASANVCPHLSRRLTFFSFSLFFFAFVF